MTIQQKTISGDPDEVIAQKCPDCRYARFVAVEYKGTEKDKPRPLQLHKLLAIRRVGGVAMIVHRGNLEQSREELEELGK